MIAAQQYYIEFNSDMNQERLIGLLPNYIPDYCLNGIDNTVEKWAQLVQQAFKKVGQWPQRSSFGRTGVILRPRINAILYHFNRMTLFQ